MHLELRVLRTSQADAAAAVNLRGWDEPAAPIAHDHEEVIESSLFQSLDDAVPAPVAAWVQVATIQRFLWKSVEVFTWIRKSLSSFCARRSQSGLWPNGIQTP
jgi:hypothetical protein